METFDEKFLKTLEDNKRKVKEYWEAEKSNWDDFYKALSFKLKTDRKGFLEEYGDVFSNAGMIPDKDEVFYNCYYFIANNQQYLFETKGFAKKIVEYAVKKKIIHDIKINHDKNRIKYTVKYNSCGSTCCSELTDDNKLIFKYIPYKKQEEF